MFKNFFFSIFVFFAPIHNICALTPIAEMPSAIYNLDKSHASITWKVSHLGLSNYTARFSNFTSHLNFNSEDITKSFVTATIYSNSIKTDYPNPEKKDFDKKLSENSDWFNSKKFPTIEFNSREIKVTSDKTGQIIGDLTMFGITKEIILETKFNGAFLEKPFSKVPALGFSATSTIKRSDFGFDTYIPMIGDEVEILIEVEYEKS